MIHGLSVKQIEQTVGWVGVDHETFAVTNQASGTYSQTGNWLGIHVCNLGGVADFDHTLGLTTGNDAHHCFPGLEIPILQGVPSNVKATAFLLKGNLDRRISQGWLNIKDFHTCGQINKQGNGTHIRWAINTQFQGIIPTAGGQKAVHIGRH